MFSQKMFVGTIVKNFIIEGLGGERASAPFNLQASLPPSPSIMMMSVSYHFEGNKRR